MIILVFLFALFIIYESNKQISETYKKEITEIPPNYNQQQVDWDFQMKCYGNQTELKNNRLNFAYSENIILSYTYSFQDLCNIIWDQQRIV